MSELWQNPLPATPEEAVSAAVASVREELQQRYAAADMIQAYGERDLTRLEELLKAEAPASAARTVLVKASAALVRAAAELEAYKIILSASLSLDSLKTEAKPEPAVQPAP